MSSTLYFVAAGLLIFAAGLSAWKNVHRQLTKPKLLAIIATISVVTIVAIFLLLKMLSRKEGEPPRQPPDYSAPSGTA
jgi:uncharacterized membrane protein YidH (DUF202 family)